jgi:V/A-type H+-transporting ATPase subunit I
MEPVVMERVALAFPREATRDVLARVADEGVVHLDEPSSDSGATGATDAGARLLRMPHDGAVEPATTASVPDLDECERAGRVDLIAGEAGLQQRMAQAVTRGSVSALVGWMPAHRMPELADRIAPSGGAVVPLPRPRGAQPPTLLPQVGSARELAPLVETYATVPYADLNPSVVAGLAYVLMFGMMFADAGHGALLLAAALLIRWRPARWMVPLRPVWLFVAGAGLFSMVFGALYGEFFGPTGVLPTLWMDPLSDPVTLLVAGVGVGAVLLGGAYALGSVNRFREGGWRRALYAPSGLAGAALFLGLAGVGGGLFLHLGWLVAAGVVVAVAGLGASYAGLLVAAGGGPAGAAEAGVEVFDLVVRLGSNLVSFARLAAFGLTHAALGAVVWQGTTALWGAGGLAVAAAVVVFVVGNAVTFGLEGLVAAIQALRLEYYELFSRIFDIEGTPFRPWHIRMVTEEAPC